MTIKNRKKNISAEPGDIVIDVTKNTLTKTNNNSNFSNNLILTIKQQDYINETNTPHTKTIEIPMSEVVRLAYLQNNYYDKTSADTKFGVTVTKQTNPDTGSAATYIIKQNNTQVGTKINIPKDFLVRSATLKTSTANNNPSPGINKGDKYLDFVINAQDDSETDTHIYINVKDLVDVYTADESTLTLSNTNQFSVKDGAITQSKLANALQTTINNKVDKVSGKGLSTNDYTNADKNLVATINQKATTQYVDDQILGILDPSGVIRLDIASKADADHSHGEISKDGKLLTANGIVITDSNQKITAVSTIKKNKISDFAHQHPTSEVTEASALSNIGSVATDTQHTINTKINTILGNKVDKVSGKGLSTNDFTTTLLNKLNGIAENANNYSHPSTYGAKTGKPTSNQAPAFGGTVTISQVTSDKYGHVTAINDKTITIPNTEASTATNGLMTIAQVKKLNGIAENANNYSHPSNYGAKTGKPTDNQTPGFGKTFTISQVTSDTYGHVTALNDKTITIPSSTAVANGANGLMTGTDKAKLDGIATGATKVLVDTALNANSTNPVQNKAVMGGLQYLTDNLATTMSTLRDTITELGTRPHKKSLGWHIFSTQDPSNAGYIKINRGGRLQVSLYDGETSIINSDGFTGTINKVTGLKIFYDINDVIYSKTTDSNGIIEININPNFLVGEYQVNFIFHGNEIYAPTYRSIRLQVS